MDRRTFLAASSASLVASRFCLAEADEGKGKDVPWLQEIQTPPAKLPGQRSARWQPEPQRVEKCFSWGV